MQALFHIYPVVGFTIGMDYFYHMKRKKIKIPIYGGEWTIIFCKSLKKVEKKYGLEPTNDFDAICLTRDTDYITAFEIDSITPGIIAHECVHLLNSIFISNGVELDRHNDETQAYLMGWLVNRVTEAEEEL